MESIPTDFTHWLSREHSTEYNDEGSDSVDWVVSQLVEDEAPHIITKRGNISDSSDGTPMRSNLLQPEEVEEGLFHDLLNNLIYLRDAKAGGNLHGALDFQ